MNYISFCLGFLKYIVVMGRIGLVCNILFMCNIVCISVNVSFCVFKCVFSVFEKVIGGGVVIYSW